jgi:hypothetical protein
VLVEEFEHVVNDRVLGLGEEAGPRKAVSGMLARGFLRRNSVRYVVEVLLRAEAILL